MHSTFIMPGTHRRDRSTIAASSSRLASPEMSKRTRTAENPGR